MKAQHKLKSMPYANCSVTTDTRGGVFKASLYSYGTKIVELKLDLRATDDFCIAGYCTGLYSMTTRKHIWAFTIEFCGANLFTSIKQSVERNSGVFSFYSYDSAMTFKSKVLEYEGL